VYFWRKEVFNAMLKKIGEMMKKRENRELFYRSEYLEGELLSSMYKPTLSATCFNL